jgi:hypothetical protein
VTAVTTTSVALPSPPAAVVMTPAMNWKLEGRRRHRGGPGDY